MKGGEFALDKETLCAIAAEAHTRYIATGNSDGVQYFTPKEIVAKAYAEAVLAVLHARGYRLDVNGSDEISRSAISEPSEDGR